MSERRRYGASAAGRREKRRRQPITMPGGENPTSRCPTRKLPNAVVALRSERGYWATEYDASAGQFPKTLRRQIGRPYDVKNVRNTEGQIESLVEFLATGGTQPAIRLKP